MQDRKGEPDLRSSLLESWLEFHDAVITHPEIKRLLYDPVTGLPTTPLLFPRIQALLDERAEASLLCLNVVRYSRIEEIYGWQVFDDVMRRVAEALEHIAGKDLRDSDIFAELMVAGNSFVIVLSPPRNTDHMDPEALDGLVKRVEERINDELKATIDPTLFKMFGCYAGSAVIHASDAVRLERLVHAALEIALEQSGLREASDATERRRRLEAIIAAGDVRTLVHPVVDLKESRVIGYEALSRGPADSEFEHPDKLFKMAYDSALVMRLERLCRRRALEAAKAMPEGQLLFLNIEPEAVSDPELRDAMLSTLLADAELTPNSIVLELTERSAVSDFCAFRSTLGYLRALGFTVAIDDAGAGYGSLLCVAEVLPEWLKVDMALVRDIDTDDVREQLVKALIAFGERTGVKLIAEGVETEAELAKLRELGIRYAQGFLFTLPVEPFPDEAALGLERFAREG